MDQQIGFEHRLTEVENRSKSNTRRLDKLEEMTDAINKMAISLERMTLKQESMSGNLSKLTTDVESLKAEPAKKWRFVVEKALYFVVGGVMAVILAKVGLG